MREIVALVQYSKQNKVVNFFDTVRGDGESRCFYRRRRQKDLVPRTRDKSI